MKSLAGLVLGLLLSLVATAAAAQNPDVSVTLSGSPQSPNPGDKIEFKAVVTNLGPGTITVDAKIRLPAGLTAASASTNGGTLNSGYLEGASVSGATIKPGYSITIAAVAFLPLETVPGYILTGEAEVTPKAPEADPTNNSATATITLAGVAPAPVPTLTEWAMILLGAGLAGGAALTLHRRRQFH